MTSPDPISIGGNGRDDPRWRWDPREPLDLYCRADAHLLCRSGFCGCPCHRPADWSPADIPGLT